ncbi:MAG: molecular chaperone DnaK [Saprospiraceae bacterium]|nr:molecular chaperone DnaK [Saprospiraceae bacterium]MBP7699127.1 molecular chaperone DnaK [Saprospiraceae bacterium]
MTIIPINIKDGVLKTTTAQHEIIVGIDLGTTNSLVAYIKDGKPTAVKNQKGQYTLVPSIVHFGNDYTVVVGEAAKEKLIEAPENTIYSVKRLMGKSYRDIGGYNHFFTYKIIDDNTDDSLVKIKVNEQFYTPVELSSFILKELKNNVETQLNTAVSKAVITVPAYFNDTQRQATRDAGKLAGWDVLRIINEPTAASLAYGLGNTSEQPQHIAVYDLGGGTFDVSILRIENGVFEVLSTNGDTFLGGDDFDKAIMDYWINEHKINLSNYDNSFKQALRLLAEAAKKTLSIQDTFTAELNNFHLTVNKYTFQAMIHGLVDRTLACCTRALKDAELTAHNIDHIVMVGGSTRVPIIKKSVSDYFGKKVYDDLNPDEVVALGAAIQADILAGNQKDILLLDITPLSLGIETIGGLMDVIIPRNSTVPTKAGRQYTTSVDGQKNLKITIYQGERDLVQHNRKLGEFILQNIPPMPAGLPKIDIQFHINADGILTVKAQELRSQLMQEIQIKAAYGISEEEMALMLLDSIRHAQSDMQVRALQEAKNEGEHIILSTEKFLTQHQSILTDNESDAIKSFLSNLKKALHGNDKNSIQHCIDNLNEYTAPLAHRAMDVTIAEAMRGKKI